MSKSTKQGEKLTGVGISIPPGAVVDPPGKVPKWVWGSDFVNLQLYKTLTRSYFRNFTFSGKNIKIRPIWKNLTPGKKFNFIFTLVLNT